MLGEALVGLGLVALYARQSGGTPWATQRGAQVLTLIGFLTAFVGTFFALDVEDVNWGAVLFADLGWVLFGAASLRARVYPRLSAALLIVTALTRGVFNPLVVYSVIGEFAASYALYEGPGAYPVVYASIGVDIVFHVLVARLGFALLFGTGTSAPRRQRVASAGGAAHHKFSSPRLSLLSVAVLLAGLLPIALVTGVFPGEQPPSLDQAQATAETNPACPPADQATYGAYSSSRLVVHEPCQHAVGTVHRVEGGETDGDEDVYVIADPEYASLTGVPQNVSNLRRFSYGGDLMMELMPRDGRSVDPDTGGTRPPHIPAPSEGDKVDVWGAWVFDSQHGYYEIHPIFSMSTSSDGGQTWGETYMSGPQYGGPPRNASTAAAYAKCRDENGNGCIGYYDPKK